MVKSRRSPGDGIPAATGWESPDQIRRFRKALQQWYRRHRRSFPWRETHDPYRIWISEIMLQQTTVAAVIPYYERFFKRFPTLMALAQAPEQDVLRHWEGLGYYSRARNLHRAAQLLIEEHAGDFPRTPEELQQLPGIGRYTAGAIASFAFDQPGPIVEANTQRLYARLTALRGDPRSTQNQTALWGFAGSLHSTRGSGGELNQALMELGGTICKPTAPGCDVCPVRQFCHALRDGVVDQIPEVSTRKLMTDVHECALLIHRKGKWLVRQIPEGERWAGLWDFPRLKLGTLRNGIAPALSGLNLSGRLKEEFGIEAELIDQLKRMKHTVTRYKIQLDLAVMEYASGKFSIAGPARWCKSEELQELPLPVTGRKIAHLLQRTFSKGGDRLF